MLTVTITSPEGQTITTNNVAIASGAMRRMLAPMTHGELADHARLVRALDAEKYEVAGLLAESLYLRLYVAKPVDEYLVPVDPADETICEACS